MPIQQINRWHVTDPNAEPQPDLDSGDRTHSLITNPHAISKAFRVTRKRSVSRYSLSLRSPWRTMVTPVKVRNTWFLSKAQTPGIL